HAGVNHRLLVDVVDEGLEQAVWNLGDLLRSCRDRGRARRAGGRVGSRLEAIDAIVCQRGEPVALFSAGPLQRITNTAHSSRFNQKKEKRVRRVTVPNIGPFASGAAASVAPAFVATDTTGCAVPRA